MGNVVDGARSVLLNPGNLQAHVSITECVGLCGSASSDESITCGKRKARPEQCTASLNRACPLLSQAFLSETFDHPQRWILSGVPNTSYNGFDQPTGPCFFSPLVLPAGLLLLPPGFAPTFPVFKKASISLKRIAYINFALFSLRPTGSLQ